MCYGASFAPETNYKTKKEDLNSNGTRVLRGGSFLDVFDFARCASRDKDLPVNSYWNYGFRVVVSPVLPS